MQKIYYLSTCSTCKKIMEELNINEGWTKQDIKTENITREQLDELYSYTKSYEDLFSRRSMKYKSMGLKGKTLTEEDFKKLILEEYTFLKRPVILYHGNIFIGNAKKTIEQAHEMING